MEVFNTQTRLTHLMVRNMDLFAGEYVPVLRLLLRNDAHGRRKPGAWLPFLDNLEFCRTPKN